MLPKIMLPSELQVLGEGGSSWFLRDLLPLTFWESRSVSSGGGTPRISQRLFVHSVP